MANLNGLSGKIIGELSTRYLGELQILADLLDKHRSALERIVSGEILREQVQLLDGVDLRVNPPAPPTPDACDPTVGESFGKIRNNRNGTPTESAEVLTDA